MKLAICSKILQDRELEDTIQISAKIGYEGIELFGFERHLPVNIDPNRLRKVKDLLDSIEMKVVCLATYLGRYSQLPDSESEKQFDGFKKYVEIAKVLEVSYIRQWCGGASPQKASAENWQKAAHWLKKSGEYASDFGITVVLETQRGTLTETVNSSLKLLDMIDGKVGSVMLTYDPGNIFIAGAEYGESEIRKLKGLIAHVHLKDIDLGVESEERHKLLGEGQIDFDSILRGLKEIEYSGYLAAECHQTPDKNYDSMAIAKHEYETIKKLIA